MNGTDQIPSSTLIRPVNHCASNQTNYVTSVIPIALLPTPSTLKSCTTVASFPLTSTTKTDVRDVACDADAGLKAYTNLPAAARSIMPGFLFGRVGRCRIVPLLAGSISTRSLRPTSVTKTVRVVGEKVAQHVASWSAIGVCERVLIERSASERESVVAPKEASVARNVVAEEEVALVAFLDAMIPLLGITTLPNSAAVPRGEERISLVWGQDP